MTDERTYTPTTEEVREIWVDAAGEATSPRPHSGAVFDRWLAARDAEVRAVALRDAQAAVERIVRRPEIGGSGVRLLDVMRAIREVDAEASE